MMISHWRAMNARCIAAVLLAVLAAPSLADAPPVRITYEGGRLSVAARNVPIGAVLSLIGAKVGFEVIDMGASSALVEAIVIQAMPLDRALSVLLDGTSYAVQYTSGARDHRHIARIFLVESGKHEAPARDVAMSVPVTTPVRDAERPPGLTPEQRKQWPQLARTIDEVLDRAYAKQPVEPPADVGLTPEEVFPEQTLKAMENLPESYLEAAPAGYIPTDPKEVFGQQALESLERIRAQQNDPSQPEKTGSSEGQSQTSGAHSNDRPDPSPLPGSLSTETPKGLVER
jgi:hypothetical protein